MAKTELGGVKSLEEKLKKIKGKGVRVTAGFYKKAKYPDGTPVAQVAYWNNSGVASKGNFIPPRPFFSDTVRDNKKRWIKIFGQLLKKQEYNQEKAAFIIGDEMKTNIADKIYESRPDNPYKANAPETIALSGNPNKEPLKDTFQMARSVGFQVYKGKPKKR